MTTKETIEKIVQDCGAELYDLETTSEFEQKIFRIYITSKDGISLDKCAQVAKILSPILDLEPPVDGEYSLEVSSPGVERPLRKLEHFHGSIGEFVKVKLINTDKIIGKLESVQKSKIVLIEEDGEPITILMEDIEKARTYHRWEN
jgi:ribosome maturation factor RimP